jgi:DNA-binding transcriptional LysR family regulator
MRRELRGLLRIAAPLTFGPTHFAPLLSEMGRRHPDLQIHTTYADRYVDLLAEGFDCAIRIGNLPDSNLVARRVATIHGKLVASPRYIETHGSPKTPEEIVGYQALMQSTETWQFMDGDTVVSIQPQGRFKADNGTALAIAAAAGLGIAWLPDCILYDYFAANALVAIMTDYPPQSAGAYVVRPPGQFPSRNVRALTELLIELFALDPRFSGVDALSGPAPAASTLLNVPHLATQPIKGRN